MTTPPPQSETLVNRRIEQRSSAGLVTWLILRVAAIMLLVLVPLKVYSGWVMVGAAPGGRFLARLHSNALVDVLLIAAVAFHALYGARTMLIEFGWAKPSRALFVITTVIALLITAAGVYFSL